MLIPDFTASLFSSSFTFLFSFPSRNSEIDTRPRETGTRSNRQLVKAQCQPYKNVLFLQSTPKAYIFLSPIINSNRLCRKVLFTHKKILGMRKVRKWERKQVKEVIYSPLVSLLLKFRPTCPTFLPRSSCCYKTSTGKPKIVIYIYQEHSQATGPNKKSR